MQQSERQAVVESLGQWAAQWLPSEDRHDLTLLPSTSPLQRVATVSDSSEGLLLEEDSAFQPTERPAALNSEWRNFITGVRLSSEKMLSIDAATSQQGPLSTGITPDKNSIEVTDTSISAFPSVSDSNAQFRGINEPVIPLGGRDDTRSTTVGEAPEEKMSDEDGYALDAEIQQRLKVGDYAIFSRLPNKLTFPLFSSCS
jgi:hypothetical protein